VVAAVFTAQRIVLTQATLHSSPIYWPFGAALYIHFGCFYIQNGFFSPYWY
jgi:hypothetical protein